MRHEESSHTMHSSTAMSEVRPRVALQEYATEHTFLDVPKRTVQTCRCGQKPRGTPRARAADAVLGSAAEHIS